MKLFYLGITFFSMILLSSCCDDCNRELSITQEKLANCETTSAGSQEPNRQLVDFNSFHGVLKKSNDSVLYSRSIKVPFYNYPGLTGETNEASPKLSIIKKLNVPNNNVILEIFKHSKKAENATNGHYRVLRDENNATKVLGLKDFDQNTTIYLITIHDEDYEQREADIDNIIIDKLKSNKLPGNFQKALGEIQTSIDALPSFIEPSTVGGGVIPPR